MAMKNKLYVSILHRQVYPAPSAAPWEFAIEADSRVEEAFSKLFSQISDVEFNNFVRSHLPFIPYHLDKENHQIDLRTMKLYALVHEFGDEESKKFVESLPYFR